MAKVFYGLVPGIGDNDEIIKFTAQDMAERPEWMYFVEQLNEKLEEEERNIRSESDDDKPF